MRPVVFEVNAFLDKVLWWSLTSTTTDSQRKAALHLLASILNKRVDVDGTVLMMICGMSKSTLSRIGNICEHAFVNILGKRDS